MWHVACMEAGEVQILGKEPTGKPSRRWEDNIKWILKT